MNHLLLKACKHGVYFNCLRCGHRHSNDGFKTVCHKDHTKEMQKLADKLTKEMKKRND